MLSNVLNIVVNFSKCTRANDHRWMKIKILEAKEKILSTPDHDIILKNEKRINGIESRKMSFDVNMKIVGKD